MHDDEKAKVKEYIDKILAGILSEANKDRKNKVPEKQIVDRVSAMTVNKLTPESKMIMSSVYDMMMKRTLVEDFFQETGRKAAFYERDILGKLNKKYVFDVPKQINYVESSEEVSKLIKVGAIGVVGGAISFAVHSVVPIGLAVIVAALMSFILKGKQKNPKRDVIEEYLQGVRLTLLQWVDAVEKFYDEQVDELKRELV